MDLCANHCSPGRIEHCAVEVAAVLREQISADAQCCKEEDVSPAIHKPRIASGTKAKQCTLSQESDDNCHRLTRGKARTADRNQDRKLRTPLANAEWILDFNFVIPSEAEGPAVRPA